MENITAEGKEEDNYENLRERLSKFHGTMLSVDGVSGEAGDRRLPLKRKSKGFDAPPAVDDAENPTPGEEPFTAAAAPPASADGAVLLLVLRHHRYHRRLRASAQAVARARPGSSARGE